MKKTARAFAPSGISSFFEICDEPINGKHFGLEYLGSRGGGFGLQKGILTEVSVCEAKTKKSNITISINGKLAPEAETTKITLQKLLSFSRDIVDICVNHIIEVPIGAGFGTSAGGSLTAGLAAASALDLPLTYNQIGKIAHVSEIQCHTGLGTVTPLTIGGCVLVIEPGAPGIGVIDRIPINSDYAVVAGIFGPTPTKKILSSEEKRREVNRFGNKTLECILDEPSLYNFLECCWNFAEKAGFTTERVRTLVRVAKKAGAVGAAQNMVGEAVHAVVLKENIRDVAEAFKQELPQNNILVSQIDFQGARLV